MLDRRQVGEIPVIALADPAEIDFNNSDRFKQAFLDLLQSDDQAVVFDGSAVQFFDSSGLGALLPIQRLLDQRGGRFVVAGLSRPVLEIFRMVGFDELIPIFDDIPSAVGSFES